MSRIEPSSFLEPEAFDLEELIPMYAMNKAELDSYKALCEEENKQIKERMSTAGLDEYIVGDHKVTYSITHKESLNEERLMEILKKHKIEGVIKTKEYVDMDALESYLYNNEPSGKFATELASCREVKEVPTLRLTKVKKRKGAE